MKNKIFLIVLMTLGFLLPHNALAITYDTVDTGEKFVEALNQGKNVKLSNNIKVDTPITFNKKSTIDLNGYEVVFTYKNIITLMGGELNITGSGKMSEEKPYFSPILLKGSADKNDTNYTVLTVGSNVILQGWAGLFIDQVNGANKVKDSYGIVANIYGKLVSVPDASGDKGHGIYVNGNIKHKENCPIINLYKGSSVSSKGVGVYSAGYSVWNISGTTITGEESGLAIKSGKFNISNASIFGTGPKIEGTYNGDGINPTGAAIQIESNNGYAGDINITIDGGTYKSTKGNVIYHYLAKKNDADTVENKLKKIVINDGSFDGEVSLLDNDNLIINKGTFTTDSIKSYVSSNSKILNNGSNYIVVDKSVKAIYKPSNIKLSNDISSDVVDKFNLSSLDNSKSGLVDAIKIDKLENITDASLIEVMIDTTLSRLDTKNNIVTYEIKPYYLVAGNLIGIIPNDAINGTVKIKIAVPNYINDTYARVKHTLNNKLLDEKSYKIETENGKKYITIETNSFSTFELEFYTPLSVSNPKTLDTLPSMIAILSGGLTVIGLTTILYKKCYDF